MSAAPYQAADGRWIIFDGTSKRFFDTEQEAWMAQREVEFVRETKADTRLLWDVLHRMKQRQSEWNALDYGNTLDDAEGVTAAQVGAVVFATTDALTAIAFGSGHATNLARLL